VVYIPLLKIGKNCFNPGAGLLPSERAARAHCRAISGEMHSGFINLRSALPMNHHSGFKVWAAAQADIDRVTSIWRANVWRGVGVLICSGKNPAWPMPGTRRSLPAFLLMTSPLIPNPAPTAIA
jgi:hypothetical protein